jgi:hypothetical protein
MVKKFQLCGFLVILVYLAIIEADTAAKESLSKEMNATLPRLFQQIMAKLGENTTLPTNELDENKCHKQQQHCKSEQTITSRLRRGTQNWPNLTARGWKWKLHLNVCIVNASWQLHIFEGTAYNMKMPEKDMG